MGPPRNNLELNPLAVLTTPWQLTLHEQPHKQFLSTTGKRGLTQKEQIEVVKRFREGGYNTLVATCVGEEGLDIGEIDLVIFFLLFVFYHLC